LENTLNEILDDNNQINILTEEKRNVKQSIRLTLSDKEKKLVVLVRFCGVCNLHNHPDPPVCLGHIIYVKVRKFDIKKLVLTDSAGCKSYRHLSFRRYYLNLSLPCTSLIACYFSNNESMFSFDTERCLHLVTTPLPALEITDAVLEKSKLRGLRQ
jgi:hypothetical protein